MSSEYMIEQDCRAINKEIVSQEALSGVEGAHNLRDLGGISAAEGRVVRPGQLIRSGELNGLSSAGGQRLAALGLGRIIDFRSAIERDAAPTLAPELSKVLRWQAPSIQSTGDQGALLRHCLVSAERSREVMHSIYRQIPFVHREAYRALFDAVMHGRPVLFHCAAGKDRTGVATALLLTLLGAEREAIRADYVASEAAIERTIANFLGKPGSEIALDVPPIVWRPMMASDPAYLDTMFGEILRRHGDVECYARQFLGLPADVGARLREKVLA